MLNKILVGTYLCTASIIMFNACQNEAVTDEQSMETASTQMLNDSGMYEADMTVSHDTQSIHRCQYENTKHATARCLTPTKPAEYYIDQANAYFDTLDITADRDHIPTYHEQVSRWEWPPWLLLTGYTRDDMNLTADVLRDIDPSTVDIRDCRFFEEQPFARCYVVFEYEGGLCPIYEEFIFNDEGEMTWIEAWSDLPALLPQGMDDPWAENIDYPRLGTRVPGLGQASGNFDWQDPQIQDYIAMDEELADFVQRSTNWRMYWLETFTQAPTNFFATGCGWPHESHK